MAIDSDAKIKKLFDVIVQKKKEIGEINNQSFKTNCHFGFKEGISSDKVNIQTLPIDGLLFVLSTLNSLKESMEKTAKQLGLTSYKFSWGGYSYDDWFNDINTRIQKLNISEKIKELKSLEARLEKIISPELKAQMELDLIEKELGV